MEKELTRGFIIAIVRIDGNIECMNFSGTLNIEEFAIMLVIIFDRSKTLIEDLKIDRKPKIIIKNDERPIEIEGIDFRRFSIKILKELE